MTRPVISFETDADLIIVDGIVSGPSGRIAVKFVLDTGAALTTITPDLANRAGYGPRDGIRRSRAQSPVATEEGYIVRVSGLEALGVWMDSLPVNVLDLGDEYFQGLLGMNFLSELDFEIRSREQRILLNGGAELARLREAHARTSRALDDALAEAKRERERADALEARAAMLLRRLEAARRSVSFRIGRASRDPRRALAILRGEDEILDDVLDEPTPLDAPVERGLPGPPTSSPLATLDTLTPHGWRDTLERDPPTLVLVRAEALAIGTPWGDWGTPGGRDGLALLGELVDWCRARRIPVAFAGAPVPRLEFDVIL